MNSRLHLNGTRGIVDYDALIIVTIPSQNLLKAIYKVNKASSNSKQQAARRN
jgi:hypothetical protein